MARREERFLEEQELSIQRRNMSGALASRRDGNRPESVAYFVLDASPYAVMSQDVEMAAGDHVSRYDATVFAALLVVLSDPRPAEASVCVAGARHGEDWVVTPTKDFKNFHTRLSQNESDPSATSKGSTTIELCLKKVRLMLRRHTKNEKIGVYVFLSRVEIESDLDAFDDLLSSMSSKCDLHLVCLAPDGASLETILTADDNIKVSTWEGPKSCWFKFLFDGKEPILPRSLLFTYKTVWEETFGCPCPAALSSRLDRIKKETEEERVKQLKAVLSGHYGTYSSVNAVIRPGTEDTSPSRSPISQLPPPPPPPPLPLLLPSCGRQSSVGHQLTTQVMESALKPGPEQGILKIYAEPLFRLRVGKLLKSVGAFLSKGKGKMKLSGSKKRGSLELWLQLDGSFSLVFLSDEDRRGGRSPELIARTPTYVRLEAGEVSTLRLKTLEGDPSGRSFTVGRSDGRGKVQVGTCFYLIYVEEKDLLDKLAVHLESPNGLRVCHEHKKTADILGSVVKIVSKKPSKQQGQARAVNPPKDVRQEYDDPIDTKPKLEEPKPPRPVPKEEPKEEPIPEPAPPPLNPNFCVPEDSDSEEESEASTLMRESPTGLSRTEDLQPKTEEDQEESGLVSISNLMKFL